MTEQAQGERPAEETWSRLFWPAVAVGWVMMAIGIRGLFDNAADTLPGRWAVLFLGSALVHDLLFAPLVVLLGLLVARARPAWARPYLQGALICTGALLLFAFPFVRGYGRQSANPSILPLDYAKGLVIALAVVWATAIGLALVRRWRGGSGGDAAVNAPIQGPTTGPLRAGDPQTIGDQALLSDTQGAALVDKTGAITWAGLPRFDSPSTFGAILGSDAGHWRIAPTGAFSVSRCYLESSLVLRTTFHADGGVVNVTDALALDPLEREHAIGRHVPSAIVRSVECGEGEVEVGVELVPRPEYGLTIPSVREHGSGNGLLVRGGPAAFVVSSTVPLERGHGAATARLRLEAGDRHAFALRQCSPWGELPAPWDERELQAVLDCTVTAWRSWSALHQTYDGPYAELVHHSGRVLRALTYSPTGAIVAAPTTSLPEAVGVGRNWDYRYSWVRDASLTLEALWVAACPDEARRYFDFFVTAAGGRAGQRSLRIMYGVGGERNLPESELDHLDGHRKSRPVRIGNRAHTQVQHDIYGELLNAAEVLVEQIGDFDEDTAEFLVDLADLAAKAWHEPDSGLWEVPGPPQHFLHSKLLCWVALDRAVRLAPALGALARVADWTASREEIRSAILEQGWSEGAGAYTQAFGTATLDAAALVLPIVGFLPAEDPRMRATIEAVADRLTDERGLVFRYRSDDGLAGDEGTFGLCMFWLVECLARLGELDRARALFDVAAGQANDVGLLSEEVGRHGEALGNTPQAFTHVGLVNAAWAIAQASDSTG
ncbi:glycoside hydrolase family 15 protein [soil metagenome]